MAHLRLPCDELFWRRASVWVEISLKQNECVHLMMPQCAEQRKSFQTVCVTDALQIHTLIPATQLIMELLYEYWAGANKSV